MRMKVFHRGPQPLAGLTQKRQHSMFISEAYRSTLCLYNRRLKISWNLIQWRVSECLLASIDTKEEDNSIVGTEIWYAGKSGVSVVIDRLSVTGTYGGIFLRDIVICGRDEAVRSGGD